MRKGITDPTSSDYLNQEVWNNNLEQVPYESGSKNALAVFNIGEGGEATGDILANYKIWKKDSDNTPNYYMFVDRNGNWYILRETLSAGDDTYEYAVGTTDITTNWTDRATQSYGRFDEKF